MVDNDSKDGTAKIIEKLKNRRAKDSFSNHLRKKLGLDGIVISFLKEFTDKETFSKDLKDFNV